MLQSLRKNQSSFKTVLFILVPIALVVSLTTACGPRRRRSTSSEDINQRAYDAFYRSGIDLLYYSSSPISPSLFDQVKLNKAERAMVKALKEDGLILDADARTRVLNPLPELDGKLENADVLKRAMAVSSDEEVRGVIAKYNAEIEQIRSAEATLERVLYSFIKGKGSDRDQAARLIGFKSFEEASHAVNDRSVTPAQLERVAGSLGLSVSTARLYLNLRDIFVSR